MDNASWPTEVRKNSLSERWRKLKESYVKRLPYAYVIALLAISFLFFLMLYSYLMVFPIFVVFLVFIFFHIGSVMESSRNLVYADKLIRLERWRLALFIFTISSYFVFLAALEVLLYLHFDMGRIPAPFNQIVVFFFSWFLFFIMASLVLNLRGFQTLYRMVKLCFRATIDELERILKQGKVPIDDAYRRFRWLKLGFQSCNGFLIKKPYCVMVKNIDQYYQHIFSFALVGDKVDLEKFSVALQKALASFGSRQDDFDLSSLLIALQLVLGKDVKGKESTEELAKMILVKPSLWERTKATIKSPSTVSAVSIVTLVVTILAIVFQFFHWGT
jgi:hypothetical protein